MSAEPFANLGYQRYQRDGYKEKGGAAALHVKGQTQDNFSSTFGLRLAYLSQLDNGVSLTPRASVGWKHTYGDVDSTTGQAFLAGARRSMCKAAPWIGTACCWKRAWTWAYPPAIAWAWAIQAKWAATAATMH